MTGETGCPQTARGPQVKERELLRRFQDFLQSGWSLVVENQRGPFFKSREKGLLPLLRCIEEHSSEMEAGVAFDRLVGRAAALLFAYARVGTVLTPLLSEAGRETLVEFRIPFVAIERVKEILNHDSSGPCPMEQRARGKSPSEFHQLVRAGTGQSC